MPEFMCNSKAIKKKTPLAQFVQAAVIGSLAVGSVAHADVSKWFENSSAELTFSTINGQDTSIDKSYQTEKTQYSGDALISEINFSTGYINDFAKVDISGLRVTKLGSDGSLYFSKGNHYGQADGTVSIKPFSSLELTTGRTKSSHVMLGSGDYRLTPTRFQLNRLSFNKGIFSFSAMDVTEALRIDDFSGYQTFKVNDKKKPLKIVEAALEKGDFRAYATQGQQKDYERYTFAEVTYFTELNDTVSLDFGVNFRRKERIGDNRKRWKNWGYEDHRLDRFAGMVQANMANSLGESYAMFAYAETENNPDMFGTVGFEWNLEDGILNGCKNTGYYVTGHKGTFNHDGGRATKVEIGHNFDGVLSGLHTSAYFAKESNIHPNDDWKHGYDQRQYERGITLRYSPAMIPGFTAEAIYAKNRQLQSGKYGMDQHTARSQLTMSYSLPLEL